MNNSKNVNPKTNAAASAEAELTLINDLSKNYKPFSFDFVGKRNIFFIIVGVIFIVGIVSFFARGFKWDIDFVGGTILEYNINKDLTAEDTDNIYKLFNTAVGFDPSSVQKSGTEGVTIKSLTLDTDKRNAVYEAMAAQYNLTSADILSANNVNPTVGKSLAQKTTIAVVVAVVLMLLYITIRFDLRSGTAAVLSLVFDLFVMLTFYSLSHTPMNISVIAAFLTILGYSINATIIVFDRIRENVRLKKGTGTEFGQIVNLGICQTTVRAVNTTLTVLITTVCVYIFGVQSIKDFVLPLMIGVISGIFSSICLSGSTWVLLEGEHKTNVKVK